MTPKFAFNTTYFLAGLGVGSMIGLLFAPKSVAEMRGYLAEKAKERSEYAQNKARNLRERAENMVERGKEVVTQKKERIAGAIDAGREAYQRETSKVGALHSA
jgi:gas vesicle protein